MSIKASVVIPTHNRCDSLHRVLLALSRQTLPVMLFEVIVIMDGSTDGTEAMLGEYREQGALPNLSWHKQESKGPAAARNAGVNHAGGPIIIFLDDDIIPTAHWIEAHLERHGGAHTGVIVLGDYAVERPNESDYAKLEFWRWWQNAFWLRTIPDRCPQYQDLFSGNVSMRKPEFLTAGGFDPAFRFPGREDYDLGYRLLQSGAHFAVEKRANAVHNRGNAFSMKTVRQAAYIEADGDVQLARKHPELRGSIRCCQKVTGRYRMIAWLALHASFLGSLFLFLFTIQAFVEKKLKMRRAWHRSYKYIQHYAYWRGIRKKLGSINALQKMQIAPAESNGVKIEISDGLPLVLPEIPRGETLVEVQYEGRLVGRMHWKEPRARTMNQNLADEIAKNFAGEIARAIAQSGRKLAG